MDVLDNPPALSANARTESPTLSKVWSSGYLQTAPASRLSLLGLQVVWLRSVKRGRMGLAARCKSQMLGLCEQRLATDTARDNEESKLGSILWLSSMQQIPAQFALARRPPGSLRLSAISLSLILCLVLVDEPTSTTCSEPATSSIPVSILADWLWLSLRVSATLAFESSLTLCVVRPINISR